MRIKAHSATRARFIELMRERPRRRANSAAVSQYISWIFNQVNACFSSFIRIEKSISHSNRFEVLLHKKAWPIEQKCSGLHTICYLKLLYCQGRACDAQKSCLYKPLSCFETKMIVKWCFCSILCELLTTLHPGIKWKCFDLHLFAKNRSKMMLAYREYCKRI